MTPLDPTLTTQAAEDLHALGDRLLAAMSSQDAGTLDAETGFAIIREGVSDLRSIGRDLLKVQDGAVATINAEMQAGVVTDFKAQVTA